MTEIAALFSLLARYAKEKQNQKDKSASDFQDWLIQRDFGWIKDMLAENSTSLFQIDELLKGGLDELKAKLDIIENTVIAVSSRIEGIDKIALPPSREEISDQAVRLLQWFESTKEPEMVVSGLGKDHATVMIYPPKRDKPVFSVEDPRFLKDDIETLMKYRWITQNPTQGSSLAFSLTRIGAEAAQQLSDSA